MVSATNVVEIEVDSDTNGALAFAPLQRVIRGKFDIGRVREPQAAGHIRMWPKPIPGQRLRFNTATGHGELFEPLQLPEHTVTRQKIEKDGFAVSPESEVFTDADAATWIYWMKRAVDAGYAKLTAGQFPVELPGKPIKDFLNPQRRDGDESPLVAAFNKLAAASEQQTKLLAALVDRLAPTPAGNGK